MYTENTENTEKLAFRKILKTLDAEGVIQKCFDNLKKNQRLSAEFHFHNPEPVNKRFLVAATVSIK